VRAAELVRRPGPRGGSEQGENAAWEKARPWAKRLVVADSGRLGEVAAGQAPVGRGKLYIDRALLEAYSAPAR
jgi:hypothetical protein